MKKQNREIIIRTLLVIGVIAGPFLAFNATAEEDSYQVAPAGGDFLGPHPALQFKESNSDRPFIAPAQNYPDGALQKAVADEISEIKRLEEKKDEVVRQRDDYESQKAQAEAEIQRKKLKIEQAKIEQAKMNDEIETMKFEMADLQGRQETVNQELNKTQAESDQRALEFNQTQEQMQSSRNHVNEQTAQLARAKHEGQAHIQDLRLQMERLIRETAANEASLAEISNQRARLDSEIAREQNDFQDIKEHLDERKQHRDTALSELKDAERRLAATHQALGEGQKELAQLNHEIEDLAKRANKTRANALAENKKLELQIAENSNAKMALDSEKAKYEVEASHMEAALAAARARNDQTRADVEQASAVVFESRMKIEKSKTEISKLESDSKKMRIDSDTAQVKMRRVSSLAASSEFNDQPIQSWILEKDCAVHSKASEASTKLGILKKGQVVAGQKRGDYATFLNSSGRAQYVSVGCMKEQGPNE